MSKTPKKLKKGALFTDIHWGRKNNSDEHNADCMRFVDWFCSVVKQRGDIDYIVFLGDWHENRSALNINTLKQSLMGAQKLNDLGLPIYFIVGNHDLYHRHTRETHSLHHLEELSNFKLIDDVTVVDEIEGEVLFAPYLFTEEYADLKGYKKIPVWMGHFEFKDFVVTGYNITMPTGPDKDDFKGPKHILSGHFHKRQNQRNIHYIGNTFPMDFSDAGDDDRGMAIYDNTNNQIEYLNWDDCPRYTKVRLSDVVDGNVSFKPNTRVNCVVDVQIDHKDGVDLRETLVTQFNLREFALDETIDLSDVSVTHMDDFDVNETTSVDDLVIEMLRGLTVDQIDNNLLIKCYEELNYEQ